MGLTRRRVREHKKFYTGIAAVLVCLMGWWYMSYKTAYVNIDVTHKEKTADEYFIYGKKEVFVNHDVLLRLKWDSSDVYRKIIPKRRYNCKVQGFRFQIFSWYRNILHCREVKDSNGVPTSGTR